MWGRALHIAADGANQGRAKVRGAVKDAVWVSDNAARSCGHPGRRRTLRGACPSCPSSCPCRHWRRLPAHGTARRTRAHARGQARQCDADLALHHASATPAGASISTVEHLLAALSGLRIDNVLVEIDGPETPIMDGSAVDFVRAIDSVGVVQQARSRRYLKIVKPVRVDHEGGFAEFLPAESGFRLDVEIDFKSPAIGRQRRVFDLDPTTFRAISPAPALSDSSATYRLCGGLASRWALRSRIPSPSMATPSSIRKVCATPTSSCATRRSTRSAICRSRARRSLAVYRTYRPGHKLNAMALEALVRASLGL